VQRCEGGADSSSDSGKCSSSRGVASEHSFEAAIGPLWLQALAAYAAPTHADGAIVGGGSSNDWERRAILNCEVLNLSTVPSHSAFNISFGLSNGENVFDPNQRLRNTL
jgi:hypothetical protein